MVRLVFRPYTQVRRSICTSESLRASTRVSSGFALLRHSSPSFGSQHACSTSEPSQKVWSGRRCPPRQRSQPFTFIARPGFPPKHSQACWTPWSVFQDGSLKAITPSILSNVCVGEPRAPFPRRKEKRAAVLDPDRRMRPRAITHPKVPHSQGLSPTAKIDAGPSQPGSTPRPDRGTAESRETRLTSSVSLSAISRTV
jgi:hypothetical protein